MASVSEVLTKSVSEEIPLWTSRALIENFLLRLPQDPATECCAVLQRCVKELEQSAPVMSSRSVAVSWLNAFVEICRKRSLCHSCGANLEPKGPFSELLGLFVMRRDIASFKAAILDTASVADQRRPELLRARRTHLKKTITEALEVDPDLGQTMVMHLVEATLGAFDEERSIQGRAALNTLLVPLLEAVFENPDRANVVYQRYHFPCNNNGRNTPFRMLYEDEIGAIERFRGRGVAERPKTLELVRQTANALTTDKNGLPRDLEQRLNFIVHGAETDPVDSPSPKATRLSQLTCLIRELETDPSQLRDLQVRKYSTHFTQLRYRQAEEIQNESPGSFRWSLPIDKRDDYFAEAVLLTYRDGYQVEFLSRLFDEETDDSKGSVWIDDGEISLYFLCAALLQAKESLDVWLNGSLENELHIPSADVGGIAFAGPGLSIGRSFDQFLTKNLCFFKQHAGDPESATPTAKCWAFISFLERVTVECRPAYYANEGHWSLLLPTLYTILVDRGISITTFREIARQLHNAVGSIEEVRAFGDWTRLPTFLLECILRDGQSVPYSLFFYPINFERLELTPPTVVPGAFLGGTFAGLEWTCFPGVIARKNYHLTAVIDAIRPIIDTAIGKVLTDDQIRHTDAQLASERKRNLREIKPKIEKLTELFHEAQRIALQVESVVDPEWAPIFGRSIHESCAQLFSSKERLEIGDREKQKQRGEPDSVLVRHEITADSRQYHAVLLYLARRIGGYDGPPIPTLAAFETAVKAKDGKGDVALLKEFRLLRALCGSAASITSDEQAAAEFAVFKILAVDSMDDMNTRGLYVVQLAAVLGLAASEAKGRVNIGAEDSKGGFNPRFWRGIKDLAQLVSNDPFFRQADRQDMNATAVTVRQFSTAALHCRAVLADSMPPYRLLRAIRILVEEVLSAKPSRASYVMMQSWHVNFMSSGHSSGTIELVLECKNCFDDSTKRQIDDYLTKDDGVYHNLRSNLKIVGEAVGERIAFAPDADANTRSLDSRKFVVFEESTLSRCSIRIVFGMSEARLS